MTSGCIKAFVAATLLIPATTWAATLEGRLLDPSGSPVSGALVESVSGEARAWTDALGRYRLDGLAEGTQVIRAVADDFEPLVVEVQLDNATPLSRDLRLVAVRQATAAVEVVAEAEDAILEIPGSVFLVSKEELIRSKPADANEVLRRTPGLTVREDSGVFGLRLNVGVRGLNPDRSRQVLMLEDGIPIALAPYGEPEMYYSPPIDRMRRVEVLKGSGQIIHGPQTVGGVINFVTPDPPARTQGSIDIEGGQRGFFVGQGSIGGSNRDQSAGWFANYLHKQGDGFRDFYFDLDDVQTKFTLKPNSSHTFGVKLGLYDETSNSTYLGLTQPLFDANPDFNPVPSDTLAVRRYSGSLTHSAVLTPRAVWSSSLFAYHTTRNWGRQDFDRADEGRDYLGVVGDPSIPGGALFLRDSAGNRNRGFNVIGGQSGMSVEHGLGGLRNQLAFGVRYIHEEMEDRRINGAGFDARTGVIRDDEDRFGDAFSGYIQNRIHFGDRVILTPGLRLEYYDYERHIQRQRVDGVPTNVDVRSGDTVTTAIPGLGLSVRATEEVTFFAGVHRGFAPPRVKDAITSTGASLQLDAELSWNYEAGARVRASRAVSGELTFFRLDFTNQIIPAAQSGGATTTLVNAGETRHQGVETSLRINWDEWVQSPVSVYTDVRYTYLGEARFTRNALFAGNRLPYAPRHALSGMVGLRHRGGFGVQLDVTRTGGQFADNNQTFTPSADGTVGRIPAYALVNLMADYTIRYERFEVRPYFTVKNLADELYIASRAPQGIQPGMFRQANAGLRFTF